jgi:L-ascorbate metabolism protein UlaG (beta-lactamase superfamily)
VSDTLRFIGHATVVIDLDGVRIITDPVLRPRIGGLVHRHPPRDQAFVHGVNAILISHLHHDHLDIPSLRRLPADAALLLPDGATPVVRRRVPQTPVELQPAETFDVGAVRVLATPALHIGYRAPFGPLGGTLGYILEGSQRIYFAGDTDVFHGLGDLGPIDVALLPVAGWGPVLGPGHMDPASAVVALKMIRPRIAVPIHWGSLVPIGLHLRTWPYLVQPPREFAELAQREVPEVSVVVLEPGQSLVLQDGRPIEAIRRPSQN